MTDCNPALIEFQDHDSQKVFATFDGGRRTANARAGAS
jgi:hypothetical protein